MRTSILLLALLCAPMRATQHIVTSQGEVVPNVSPTALVIVVGSRADHVGSAGTASCAAQSLSTPPTTSSAAAPLGAGTKCTLRSAVLLAKKYSNDTAVTIAVRTGRITLLAPLPTLTGTVQIIGSVPKRAKAGDGWRWTVAASSETGSKAFDDDDFDPHFPHGETSGQSGPIGTVIDGGGRVQLLRTAPGSAVHLRTIRLENGAALESGEDVGVRGTAGGAIHSRGTLVLTNVAIRNCRAITGGGIYTDGPEFEAHDSTLTASEAKQCGGCVYAALPGRAHFERCTLSYCNDRCGRHFGRVGGSGRYKALAGREAAALPGGSAAAAAGAAAVRGPARGGPVGLPPGALVDSSGALAQGPPLVDEPLDVPALAASLRRSDESFRS